MLIPRGLAEGSPDGLETVGLTVMSMPGEKDGDGSKETLGADGEPIVMGDAVGTAERSASSETDGIALAELTAGAGESNSFDDKLGSASFSVGFGDSDSANSEDDGGRLALASTGRFGPTEPV